MIVYKITNLVNSKCYIGITKFSISKRFKEHVEAALYDKTKNTHLYNAIKTYGKHNFKIELIENVNSIEELSVKEQFYIKSFNTLEPNGYNYLTGGLYNYNLTEAHRLTLSKPLKAKSTIDGSEFFFISGLSVPRPFSNSSISPLVDKDIEYRGYLWSSITKEEYLTSSKNSDIKDIPILVAIKDSSIIFIGRNECPNYGFDVGKAASVAKGIYGRKTHKGYKFMYYKDYVEGMPTDPSQMPV